MAVLEVKSPSIVTNIIKFGRMQPSCHKHRMQQVPSLVEFSDVEQLILPVQETIGSTRKTIQFKSRLWSTTVTMQYSLYAYFKLFISLFDRDRKRKKTLSCISIAFQTFLYSFYVFSGLTVIRGIVSKVADNICRIDDLFQFSPLYLHVLYISLFTLNFSSSFHLFVVEILFHWIRMETNEPSFHFSCFYEVIL